MQLAYFFKPVDLSCKKSIICVNLALRIIYIYVNSSMRRIDTLPSLGAAPVPTPEQLAEIAAKDAARAVRVVSASEITPQVTATLDPASAPASGMIKAQAPAPSGSNLIGQRPARPDTTYSVPGDHMPADVVKVSASMSEQIARRVRSTQAQEPLAKEEEAPVAQRRPLASTKP